MYNLETLGWNSFFQQQLDKFPADSLEPGRIAVENKHRYIVYSRHGELTGEVTGKLLFLSDSPSALPKTGDWVLMNIFQEEGKAIIHEVLERKTKFSRKAAGDKFEEQIIAANIDTLFIVQSLDDNFNPRRLERNLVMARKSNIKPVIILSKSDLCGFPDEFKEKALKVSGDAHVIVLSSLTGSGIAELISTIEPGLTYAFTGSSGTGKSTIINKLAGRDLQKTAEVREKDSKGRHTTSKRELIILDNGGLLIDTPGMRELHLWDAENGIKNFFDDIEILSDKCRFSDCTHIVEKDCAVLEALQNGTLTEDRYKSYIKLIKEEKFLESKTDKNIFLEKKQKEKRLHKEIKKMLKNNEINH